MPWSRQFWVVLHRWAGLTLALFLIVAGATGALMPFYDELNVISAPWRVIEAPRPGAPTLDPLVLNEKALAALPSGSSIDFIGLAVEPGRAINIYATLPPGTAYDYISLNPYTGAVVHRGTRANLADGMSELMPFILQLHFALAMGEWGAWAFGIAAVIWTIDCFVGFYLTLPVSRRGWFKRWRKAWSIKWPAPSRYRLNFGLHRAGGLWLWPILFVFAWSSVAMNLRPVYDPVMQAIGLGDTVPPISTHAITHKPDWPWAVKTGRRLAVEHGRQMGYSVSQDGYIYFDTITGLYSYNFASSRDITDKGWSSMVMFDPSGRLAAAQVADGGLKNGGATVWLLGLHTAVIGGLAYRIFVLFLGLAIVALSVTGIVVWMRKRSARLLSIKRPSPLPLS